MFLFLMLQDEGAVPLVVSGVINTIMIASLLRQELKRVQVYMSPFAVYLCAGVFRLGLSSIWLGAALFFNHQELRTLGIFEIDNVVEGLFLLQVGDLIFNVGYFWGDRLWLKEARSESVKASKYLLEKAILLYAIGWGIRVSSFYISSLFGATILFNILSSSIPMLASFFLLEYASSNSSERRNRIVSWLFFGVMTGLDLVLALQSYMKSGAALAIFPLVAFVISRAGRSEIKVDSSLIRNGFVLATCILFLGLFVFPFWQLRRESYDFKTSTYSLTIDECVARSIAAAVPGSREFNECHAFPSGGAWGLLHRHCNTVSASWSFDFVAQNGTLKGKMLTEAFPALVPRVLWEGKPQYSPAAYVSVLMGLASSVDSATTATDAGGMAGGLYLDLGWIGLVLGMAINGLILAKITYLLQNHVRSNLFAGIGWVILYAACATHFESSMDGNVTLWGMLLVVVLFPFYIYNRTSS
jgi:hypothetical protein